MSANTPLFSLREGVAHAAVMGILNVTPDSFFSASRSRSEAEICRRAGQILEEGGDIIDIGGVSTRPGAESVGEEEERDRLRVALRIVRREFPDAYLSVDTFRPTVAQMAVEEFGVQMVNDVSEGGRAFCADDAKRATDGVPPMFSMVARLGVDYVLTSHESAIEEMKERFARELALLDELGCPLVVLDPGYGFGKNIADDFGILRRQKELLPLKRHLLAGVSRKRMAWQALDLTPETALNATTALNVIALEHGANILRVHDVAAANEARTMHFLATQS